MARNTNKPINIFSSDVNKLEVSTDFLDNVSEWSSFYRCYPFIFAEDFLGIKLKPFQKIILYQMFHNDYNMFLAARGLSKSWMLAVFVICWANLYPGSKIVISAGQKRMCMEVIGYIKAFYDDSECLRRSISYLSDSINDARVAWVGGSSFKIAVANDNARGARCHVLILDEHRTIKLEVINSVLRQFASDRRRPKFYDLPEWKDYPMTENKEIYASSTYYCHHWSYDKFKDYFDQMKKGKSYFLVDLPYQVSVKYGIKSLKQIMNQMTENTFNPISWKMEAEGRWVGQDSSAFFKYELLEQCRKLKKPFYTRNEIEAIGNKKYVNMDKIKSNNKNSEENEIRFLFADIAMSAGDNNDHTILGIMRAIPRQKTVGDNVTKYYMREVPYMKSIIGGRVDEQALEIKKMYEEFNADFCVLDCQGLGQAIFDELSKPIVDINNGVEYNTPWTCINDEKLAERCTYPNAKPVIYAIHGSAQLNSDIHFDMLNVLTLNRIAFLISENDAKDIVSGIKGFYEMTPENQMSILEQYYQASALINEMVNLTRIDREGGQVKLIEPSNGFKDRYMAVAYASYIISTEFERKLNRIKKKKSSFNFTYTPPSYFEKGGN